MKARRMREQEKNEINRYVDMVDHTATHHTITKHIDVKIIRSL